MTRQIRKSWLTLRKASHTDAELDANCPEDSPAADTQERAQNSHEKKQVTTHPPASASDSNATSQHSPAVPTLTNANVSTL